MLRGLAIGRDRIDIGWSGGGLDVDGLPAGMEVIRQRAPAGIDDGPATELAVPLVSES